MALDGTDTKTAVAADGDGGDERMSLKQFVQRECLGLDIDAAVDAALKFGFRGCTRGTVATYRSQQRAEPETLDMKEAFKAYVLSQPDAIDPEQLAANAIKLGYPSATAQRIKAIRTRAANKTSAGGLEGSLKAFVLAIPEDVETAEVVRRCHKHGFPNCTPKHISTLRWQAKRQRAIQEGLALRGKPATVTITPPPKPAPTPMPTPMPTPEMKSYDTWEERQRRAAELRAPKLSAPRNLRAEFNEIVTRLGTERVRAMLAEYEAQLTQRLAGLELAEEPHV